MARKAKSTVNRSQAIRDYLAKSPKASPTEIKEALAKEGIEVSDSLISAVKYKKKAKGKRGKKRGRPAGATAKAASVSVESLVAAKKMVNQLGGIAAAEKAIGILKRLG
ncbi:MAG: hypothetical protein WD875_09425 [Pirellulales bacterium]